MNKWDYIRAISQRGDFLPNGDGILALLDYYDKQNTMEITEDEAREFYYGIKQADA